jgi:His/Glu/Gln/Arg/opine family amino acid ABC transporter permease subunit
MDLFLQYLSQPYLVTGIVYTLLITVLGLGGGLVMGVVLAGMQLSRFGALALLSRTYAIIFRGTPLILQMIFCYNALPLIGIKLSSIEAASLALALNEAPFIADNHPRQCDRRRSRAGECGAGAGHDAERHHGTCRGAASHPLHGAGAGQ